MPAPGNAEPTARAADRPSGPSATPAPVGALDAAPPLPGTTPAAEPRPTPLETWVPPVTPANTPSTEVAPSDVLWRREAPWRPARRMPAPRRERRRGSRALRSLSTSAKLGAVLFVAYGLMFNFSVVRGSSMAPGIHDGDRILVDHLSYVFQDVQRGDIVVLQYPLDPSLDYIKRVIGLPGDRVEIHNGGVWVNGERLSEPYVAEQDPRARLALVVEPEHFFVLGDNRPHSSDSREFGQVPRENLRGRVEVRVWPPERMGTLD